jgi:hypothetical protein
MQFQRWIQGQIISPYASLATVMDRMPAHAEQRHLDDPIRSRPNNELNPSNIKAGCRLKL